jgi:RNA polymerase sigma-70 factor (ECF subfamily)
MGASGDNSHHRFATTSWSLVLQAQQDGDASPAALAALLGAYWYPLYGFLRRKGFSSADAEDAIQDFIARVLTYDVVAYADRSRGRFRTFLLSALEQYLPRWKRSASGPGRISTVPIDTAEGESRYLAAAAGNADTPARFFEREWMRTVLARVLMAVETEYVEAGKGAFFIDIRGALMGQSEVAADVVGRSHGMSPGAVRVAVHRVRKRFAERLREEIAQIVESPDHVDDELNEMFRLFSSDER